MPPDSPLRDQSVLVTGGAGFIGSHIVDAVAPHNDVTIIDDMSHPGPYEPPEGVELVEADVRDEDALSRAMADADVVFHEAAIVSVTESVEDPVGSHGVNLGGTLAVLEAARDADARVVFASSTAIYGEPKRLPVPESHPTDPQSPYGAQKLGSDVYARLYADLYGLETIALRYFNVYGPRQRAGPYGGVISVFVDQAIDGRPLTVHGDGSQTRDFVHVDDVVRANLLAATTDRTGRSYNVGTGTETSVRELAETIRDVSGSDSEIVHEDPRSGDVERSRADISRIRDELEFEPMVPLPSGLRDVVERVRDS